MVLLYSDWVFQRPEGRRIAFFAQHPWSPVPSEIHSDHRNIGVKLKTFLTPLRDMTQGLPFKTAPTALEVGMGWWISMLLCDLWAWTCRCPSPNWSHSRPSPRMVWKGVFFFGGGGKEDMRRPHAEQGVRHDEIATKDWKIKDHLCSVDQVVWPID